MMLIPSESSSSSEFSNQEVRCSWQGLSKQEKESRELAILRLVSMSLRELLAQLMIGLSRMMVQLSWGKLHLLIFYQFLMIFLLSIRLYQLSYDTQYRSNKNIMLLSTSRQTEANLSLPCLIKIQIDVVLKYLISTTSMILIYNLSFEQSSILMYNLSSRVQEAHGHQITQQQLQQVKKVDEYLTANHVHEIMNEALARLIENRPQKVKEGLISIFKSIKEKQTYFKKIDFQNMFQSYDFFSSQGGNQIPYQNLIQSLQKINIVYSKEQFLQKYPQFKLDRTVRKLDFVNIMETEYRKKIKL